MIYSRHWRWKLPVVTVVESVGAVVVVLVAADHGGGRRVEVAPHPAVEAPRLLWQRLLALHHFAWKKSNKYVNIP